MKHFVAMFQVQICVFYYIQLTLYVLHFLSWDSDDAPVTDASVLLVSVGLE